MPESGFERLTLVLMLMLFPGAIVKRFKEESYFSGGIYLMLWIFYMIVFVVSVLEFLEVL